MFFETIKVLEGRVHALDYHQKRVQATCNALDLGPALDLGMVIGKITLPETGLHRLRINYGTIFKDFEITPYTPKKIQNLVLIDKDDQFYKYKYQDRSVFTRDLQNLAPGAEPIYLVKGRVTETSFAALVFENSEGLFTPADYLLPSTKIAALLDSGLVKKRPISEADLGSFDRVHLVNAMLDLGELCLPSSLIGRQ